MEYNAKDSAKANLTLNKIRHKIFRIIQIGNTEDAVSKLFDVFITVVILINLFIVFFDTTEASAAYTDILDAIEFVTVIIFTIEYLLRIFTADFLYPRERHIWGAEVRFIFSLYGLIDLLTFLPFYLPIMFPSGIVAFRMLRVIRIFRLFRVNAYYDAFNIITDVLKEKKNQIMSAVFIILLLILASSLIMFNLEHDAQPDKFKDAFSGIWWAVSTLLTVGYGDIYPITPAGRFVGIILVFLGVGIVAVPTGIISAGFVEQYTKIKSFSSSKNEHLINYISVKIDVAHPWSTKQLSELSLVPGVMIIAITRDGETFIPHRSTVLYPNDILIIGSTESAIDRHMRIKEVVIDPNHPWLNMRMDELDCPIDQMILLIKRGRNTITPAPNTIIRINDKVVVLTQAVGEM